MTNDDKKINGVAGLTVKQWEVILDWYQAKYNKQCNTRAEYEEARRLYEEAHESKDV